MKNMAIGVVVVLFFLRGGTAAEDPQIHRTDGSQADATLITSTTETTSIGKSKPPERMTIEAEKGTGQGEIKLRSKASGKKTVWLHEDESRRMKFNLPSSGNYGFSVRYSNDNINTLDCETVWVRVDGLLLGSFIAADTGDGGMGWNVFRISGNIGYRVLVDGVHRVRVSITGGDGYGVEIDCVKMELTHAR